jgi:hypothetical protein
MECGGRAAAFVSPERESGGFAAAVHKRHSGFNKSEESS